MAADPRLEPYRRRLRSGHPPTPMVLDGEFNGQKKRGPKRMRVSFRNNPSKKVRYNGLILDASRRKHQVVEYNMKCGCDGQTKDDDNVEQIVYKCNTSDCDNFSSNFWCRKDNCSIVGRVCLNRLLSSSVYDKTVFPHACCITWELRALEDYEPHRIVGRYDGDDKLKDPPSGYAFDFIFEEKQIVRDCHEAWVAEQNRIHNENRIIYKRLKFMTRNINSSCDADVVNCEIRVLRDPKEENITPVLVIITTKWVFKGKRFWLDYGSQYWTRGFGGGTCKCITCRPHLWPVESDLEDEEDSHVECIARTGLRSGRRS